MKKQVLVLMVLIVSAFNYSFGQFKFPQPKDSSNFEIKINPDYFLLGTFSDYINRFYRIDKNTQIDIYDADEESLAKYISTFIVQHYNIKNEVKIISSRHSQIIIPSLAQQLNTRFFDEKGNYLNITLDSEDKMYSFLLGAYYRYGKHLDGNIYKIQVANSQKDIFLYRILKDLECDKLVYKFLRGYIPSSDFFFFEATPRMIKYFKTIEKEKEILDNSFLKNTLNSLSEDKKSEIKETLNQYDKEIIKNLKAIFK